MINIIIIAIIASICIIRDIISIVDYDIIGLSYYPIWHGKSLNNLKAKMQYLGNAHQKKILIAETAYPFTLDWNDWTNNIVGIDDQLILPEFPATPEGQRKFINEIKALSKPCWKGSLRLPSASAARI